jgi:hypothetical protein
MRGSRPYPKLSTETAMTNPPPSGAGDQYQPPPDPPVEFYRPPQFPPPYPYPPAQSYPPAYPQAPHPYATPAYQYADPYQFGPYAPARPTDGMAIAALVVSCVAALGLCAYGLGGLLGIPGAILGHVARRRIKVSGANGDGLALAGLIVGWIATAIGVVAIVGLILLITLSDDFQ